MTTFLKLFSGKRMMNFMIFCFVFSINNIPRFFFHTLDGRISRSFPADDWRISWFFPMHNWRISGFYTSIYRWNLRVFPKRSMDEFCDFFYRDRRKKFSIFSITGWRISLFFLHNPLRNFAMLPCDQMIKFTIYFPKFTDAFRQFFSRDQKKK